MDTLLLPWIPWSWDLLDTCWSRSAAIIIIEREVQGSFLLLWIQVTPLLLGWGRGGVPLLWYTYCVLLWQGKGTENVTHYPRAKLTYLDIPNIHSVRESYDSLRSLCLSGESNKWHSSLENTQWLNFISLIIKVSWRGTPDHCGSIFIHILLPHFQIDFSLIIYSRSS